MNLERSTLWTRRGFSLLWDHPTLMTFAKPNEVYSLRQLFALAENWPQDLPSMKGDALVVAGIEGCLDSLNVQEGEEWLRQDIAQILFKFQDHYQSDAALVFWLPSGRQRIFAQTTDEEYFWQASASSGKKQNTPSRTEPSRALSITRCLWGGAYKDAQRIIVSDAENPDPDGEAYKGLYLSRIS